jgi:hexosaminidase
MQHPALIPLPRIVRWGEGRADFSRLAPRFRIVAPELAGPQFELAYEALARAVSELTGWRAEEFPVLEIVDDPEITAAGSPLEGAFGLILAELGGQFGDEGYRLTVGPGALVQANAPAGLFYGVQTLRQMLRFEDGRLTAPCCVVEDWPAFPWRGIMLDQGRNYQSPEFLRRQIDIASRYKLNVFHLHLTEYPGWRFETRAFPHLKTAPFYTQEELRELVDYAAARFVNVMPEIEMPGHCAAFLDLMPHLKCTNDTMCMGSEELYETLRIILEEVAEVFPSPYIHIGTDECEGGADCPRCQARWREISSQPDHPPTLMAYFISRMNEVVKSLGRTTVTWNDQLDQGIPKDVVIHAWKADSHAPSIAAMGYRVINSSARAVYFDHGLAPEYVRRIYEWSPTEDAPAPVPGILGGQGEAWHDPPVEDEWQIIEDLGFYPRLLALAERVWQGPDGRAVPFEEFERRLLDHRNRYFQRLPFPYPDQAEDWKKRYQGWTQPRGIWTPPEGA